MAAAVLLFLQSLCFLSGVLPPVVGVEGLRLKTCCKHGRVFVLENELCASLPRLPQSPIYRMVQKQCCHAAVKENLCTNGISCAKRNGVRDPYEVDTAKMCCECCRLGLLAKKEDHTCELQIPLNLHCKNVAQACCLEKESGLIHQASPLLSGGGTKEGPDLCADYNECLSGTCSCRPGERCINTKGSYRCQRKTSCCIGYELTNTNTCQDIDECLKETHNCGREFTCQNTAGSFRCHPRQQCGLGFIQDAIGKCIDINECVHEKSPCQSGQTCINTSGSYMCAVTCGRGYHLNTEGTHCIDNDECRIYPRKLCDHKCENTAGSYRCSCHSGFKLASYGKNCEDVNECENNPCSQECANVYGSYQCYCHRGYQLNNMDRHACEDIDECATDTHNCSASQSCFNILGGFRCLSFECPPYYRRATEGRCERLNCKQNSRCQSLPLRISFYNLTFPTNISIPAAVFRMGPSSSVPGEDIQLVIVDGDAEEFFSIQKTAHGAEMSVQRPLLEPRDFLLTVEIRLIRYGIRSIFVAKIAVCVVTDQFGVSNNWPKP